MSWIQKLNDTYEACLGSEPSGSERLLPVSHAYQQAHVEVTLTGDGKFESARTIGKVETAIPATEASAGRVGTKPPPHPLCDKVQYCSSAYPIWGGLKPSFFKEYKTLLSDWCSSEYRHPKAEAVLTYICSGTLIADLIREKVLHAEDGKLITQWQHDDDVPEILKVLTAKAGERDQGDAFIRWQVRDLNSTCTAVWEDATLQDAWARYDASTKQSKGLCMVTGQSGTSLAVNHPKRIRHAGDGAKLISANDATGFTFRGRFVDDTGAQACGIGYEITQKAHNALRWLIKRQSYRNGDQVIVSWATSGAAIPDPFVDSFDLLEDELPGAAPIVLADPGAGQAYARRLTLALKGYRAQLGDSADIVVMGLDSATPGRMAITYYRELTGSEFLGRIEQWHTRFAWLQNFGKNKHFVGTPAPHDIAEAAYGSRVDEKLKKATVERLVPCLIDGQLFPRDLLTSIVRRASQRTGMPHWAWEKALGIACALYRGTFHQEEYAMALETERTTRDYLYGRLLALADHIEGRALHVGGESRDSTAVKLMQRFAQRPASTWRTIELALAPAKSRLRAKRGGFMHEMDRLHDQIVCAFQVDDFTNDNPLSGEFLLGYHCQRDALKPPPKVAESGVATAAGTDADEASSV